MATLTRTRDIWHLRSLLYGLILAATLLLSGLTFLGAHASGTSNAVDRLFLIRLTLLVPIIAVWLLAARSARRFKNYAVLIGNSKDGQSINNLANGLLLVLAYLVLLSLASPIIGLFEKTSILNAATALVNHVPLLVAIGAAWLLFKGSQQLVALTGKPLWNRSRIVKFAVPFGLAMSAFSLYFYSQASQLEYAFGVPRFVLPIDTLMLTYVLPYVVVWLLGFVSALNLAWYAKHAPGIIYKSLFYDTCRGLVLVYVGIFLTQLLISASVVIRGFDLGLLFVYGIVILEVVGYSLLYRGAVKLQRIEEVG